MTYRAIYLESTVITIKVSRSLKSTSSRYESASHKPALIFVLSMTGLLVNIFGEFHLVRFTLNLCGFLVIGISWLLTKRGRAVTAINLMLYSALVIFGISVLFQRWSKDPKLRRFFRCFCFSKRLFYVSVNLAELFHLYAAWRYYLNTSILRP